MERKKALTSLLPHAHKHTHTYVKGGATDGWLGTVPSTLVTDTPREVQRPGDGLAALTRIACPNESEVEIGVESVRGQALRAGVVVEKDASVENDIAPLQQARVVNRLIVTLILE